MLDAIATFFNHFGQTIQTFAVLAGLVFILIQTRQLGRQLQLGNISSTRSHFAELNHAFLHDSWVLEKIGTKPETVLAALFIGTLETRFEMREAGLLKPQMWAADIETMIDTFCHELMLREWLGLEHEYYLPFAKIVNEKIIPEAKVRLATRMRVKAKPLEGLS